ncbi:MAG: NAD(P)-binding protein, partial [Microbacterium sp.]
MARATVIGSGPNGLAAAVTLARAGYAVEVLEASETVGGGVRTMPGPLPGFVFDVCSAVHPSVLTSPFFQAFGIRDRIDWITPEISYAHPLDGGRAAIAWRDIDRTADDLGSDARAWYALVRPLTRHLEGVVDFTGHALLRMPDEPITALRYGIRMLEQGTPFARLTLRTEAGAALIAGVVAHANAPMPSLSGA